MPYSTNTVFHIRLAANDSSPAAGYVERNEVLHKMELKRLSRSY